MKKEGIVRLTQKLAKERGVLISKENTNIVVGAMLDALVEGLTEEGEVILQNYLTIKTVEHAEKKVPVEIGSKETKIVPAHNVVKISTGKLLRDVVEAKPEA